jgi:hypothetical protein
MLNDYFRGTTGVWLNIPVDKNSTMVECEEYPVQIITTEFVEV